MRSRRSAARHLSVYGAALRLYPRSFRADYGEPMLQLFADRFRDLGAKAWLRTIPDLARTVTMQRTEAVMSRHSVGARVVAIAIVALGAVVVGVGNGGPLIPVAALIVLAAGVSQRRLVASAFGSDRVGLGRAIAQTWWAPVAALLGVLELTAGVANIRYAHNTGGRIIGSAILIAFGVGMLYGLVRRPFARPAANAVILVATIPPLLVFWLIIPTVLALVVWGGVISSGFGDRPVPATS